MKGIFQLSFIHDSFGVLAPYVEELRKITVEEFFKIHEENQLEKFKQEIEDTFDVTLPQVPRRGNFDISTVLESDYLFA
jgi:DNA-directed RNA polymerase